MMTILAAVSFFSFADGAQQPGEFIKDVSTYSLDYENNNSSQNIIQKVQSNGRTPASEKTPHVDQKALNALMAHLKETPLKKTILPKGYSSDTYYSLVSYAKHIKDDYKKGLYTKSVSQLLGYSQGLFSKNDVEKKRLESTFEAYKNIIDTAPQNFYAAPPESILAFSKIFAAMANENGNRSIASFEGPSVFDEVDFNQTNLNEESVPFDDIPAVDLDSLSLEELGLDEAAF